MKVQTTHLLLVLPIPGLLLSIPVTMVHSLDGVLLSKSGSTSLANMNGVLLAAIKELDRRLRLAEIEANITNY